MLVAGLHQLAVAIISIAVCADVAWLYALCGVKIVCGILLLHGLEQAGLALGQPSQGVTVFQQPAFGVVAEMLLAAVGAVIWLSWPLS